MGLSIQAQPVVRSYPAHLASVSFNTAAQHHSNNVTIIRESANPMQHNSPPRSPLRHLNLPMPMATIADRCADICQHIITDEPIVSVAGGRLTIALDRLPDNPMSFADGEHLAREILRAIGRG